MDFHLRLLHHLQVVVGVLLRLLHHLQVEVGVLLRHLDQLKEVHQHHHQVVLNVALLHPQVRAQEDRGHHLKGEVQGLHQVEAQEEDLQGVQLVLHHLAHRINHQ